MSTDPGAAAPSGDGGWKQTTKISGVKVDFRGVPSLKDVVIKHGPLPVSLNEISSTQMVEGQQAVLQFRLTDSTGTPLTGLRMAAWLDQMQAGKAADNETCRRKIQSFLQMRISARPEVDLNTYYILALTQEPSILVIDPRVGFSTSKLYAMIDLQAPGEDWVLSRNNDRLFVTMPTVNKVAALDAMTFRTITNIETWGKPGRLAFQPDGQYLWVANDSERPGESGVTVINATTLEVAARIPTGKGHHEIVFDENQNAYVSNQAEGTVSIISIPKLAKVKDIDVGRSPVALAYSGASMSVYVAGKDEGAILVISSESLAVTATLKDKPGFTAMLLTPDGRWGFVANGSENNVLLFDVSSNKFLQRYEVGRSPDQLALTTAYVYVRSKESDHVHIIPLNGVGSTAHTAEFPAGQNQPGALADILASPIAASQDGDSAFVANPADRRIYYYQEGMAAPMSSMESYGRVPKAVKVLDRSIRETQPGVYSVGLRLPKPGTYDVPLFVESPSISNCFEFTVLPNPLLKKKGDMPVFLRAVKSELKAQPGEPVQVAFDLVDTATGKPREGIKDVQVTVLLAEGLRQLRFNAEPAEDGAYQFTFTPTIDGVYYAMVQVPSLGIRANQLSYIMIRATAPESSEAKALPESPKTQPNFQ
ncbi:MAG: YncE family protein [Acidobacteriia bacterium]|nr:YncE family protein [Terriglobia bacterium]